MSQPYLVSARKYRPQNFQSVVGQSHITTTLKNAIKNDQIAHAYLFFGPRGVGKTTCARILAKTINCEHPTEDLEACGTCSTCLAFDDNANMNIFELDAASHNSVDDIRTLNEQVRFVPQQGKYKIYIIDEVHMLSTSAFNAFLKTLEEPPHYAIFILATTEKHKVLPTILSRCQIFDFKRIQIRDIAEHLSEICDNESIEYDMNALHLIAQKAEGGMRDALSIMDRIASFSNQNISYDAVIEHLNILDASVYFEWTNAFLKQDFGHALLLLDKHLQLGFEGDMIIGGLAEHFRNLLLSQDTRLLQLIDLPEEFKKQYYDQSQIVPEHFLINGLSIINKTELDYKITLNKRLLLEICFIKLAHLKDLYTSVSTIETDKKKIISSEAEPIARSQVSVTAPMDAPNSPVATSPISKPLVAAPTQSTTPPPPLKKESHSNNTPIGTSASTVSNTVSRQAPPGLKKKASKMLQDLHNNNANLDLQQKQLPITEALVLELLEVYKKELMKVPEKQPFVTQLEMMKINFIDPTHIQFECYTAMTQSYADKASEEFRDFLRNKTLDKVVRVTTHLDVSQRKEIVIERPKTKLDTFHEMIQDFPFIEILKSKYRFDVE